MLSPDLQGQLTTSGIGHIRFWQMAETFTGLKLQGQLGRFGKTSVSDIEGFVQLPDGKVVSGCEWGNLLVWEGGLIKVSFYSPEIQLFCTDLNESFSVYKNGFLGRNLPPRR